MRFSEVQGSLMSLPSCLQLAHLTDPGVDAEVWEVTGISKSQNMREVILMTNEECVL
jgi:hypothetical protein